MKQGSLNGKIVMLLLLAAVVVYLAAAAWRSFRDPFTTVASYSYTVDDSLEATGFLVREEQVLTNAGGVVELLPQEGEKVARGGTVALVYQDSSGLERRQQLQQLELEKEQLEYALERTGAGGGDASQLTGQVLDAIAELRAALSDVNSQISALSSQAAQSTRSITAGQSGVFSGYVDGYEGVLTPQALETLTPAGLDALAGQAAGEDPAAVGKLITDTTWSFACALPQEEAERLVEGRAVTVRFSRDWSGEISMTVERVSEPESGRCAVVLSTDKYLSDTTLLRRQTVELVFQSLTGVRVPKQALRVEEQTVTDPETEEETTVQVPGVYTLVGEQVEFKPVTVLEQGDTFALVEAAASGRAALQPGDVVVVAAEDLYDGKVIQ